MPSAVRLRRRIKRLLRGSPDDFVRRAAGVIHVGANSGQERERYARAGIPVVWIEPIPEVFEELRTNISEYPDQVALRALVGDRDGVMVELNVAGNAGESSSLHDLGMHRDIWPDVGYVRTLTLEMETLPRVLEAAHIDVDRYDALVIDTQGAELQVLEGARPLLGGIRFVQAEAADFEAYVGGCTRAELGAFMTSEGFHEVCAEPFAEHPSGGRYFDVLYARS